MENTSMAKKKTGLPAKTTKRGPLSNAEKGTIKRLAGKQSAEQISGALNRPLDIVTRYLLEIETEPEDTALTLADELHQRPEWRKFKLQFNDEELSFFTYRYVQLMDQFGREDVTHTEEMQIFNLITVEILIDRNLQEQNTSHKVMTDLQSEIEIMSKNKDMTEHEMEMFLELNTQYDTARAGIKSASDRYKQLSDKQSSSFKELKSTRDQRVKVNENPANSFLGLLKQLNQADFARRAGREAEMMKRAADAEKKRLSRPHRYEDGMVDQPILTAETLIDDYDHDSVRALPRPDAGDGAGEDEPAAGECEG
jgi:hypothetical protein